MVSLGGRRWREGVGFEEEKGEGLTSRGHPAPAGDVGNGALVADEEAGGLLGEVGVHCAVETAGLVEVAVDAVLDLFGGVAWVFFCEP
jgi:hypothetical protein